MSRFRYRMQNILNIKASMETQAKNQYAAANEKLRQEQDKLDALVLKKKGYEQHARDLLLDTLKIQEINDTNRMVLFMEEEIKKQQKEVNYAMRNVEKARDKMTEAMKERKTYERLREKAFEQFLMDEKAAESKEIDQLTSYTYGQKIAAED